MTLGQRPGNFRPKTRIDPLRGVDYQSTLRTFDCGFSRSRGFPDALRDPPTTGVVVAAAEWEGERLFEEELPASVQKAGEQRHERGLDAKAGDEPGEELREARRRRRAGNRRGGWSQRFKQRSNRPR